MQTHLSDTNNLIDYTHFSNTDIPLIHRHRPLRETAPYLTRHDAKLTLGSFFENLLTLLSNKERLLTSDLYENRLL